MELTTCDSEFKSLNRFILKPQTLKTTFRENFSFKNNKNNHKVGYFRHYAHLFTFYIPVIFTLMPNLIFLEL